MNIPRIERRIIIGYSNLLFLISIKYFFEIDKMKNEDMRIKDFINNEKLSTTMLLLKSFLLSKLLLKIINKIIKITKLERL